MPTPPPIQDGRVSFRGALDLEATLYSGQSFRWRRLPENWHQGLIGNRPIRVRATSRLLEWRSPHDFRDGHLRTYFRLDDSHDEFLARVRRDEPLRRAIKAFPGLRLLRQDPWELLLSFSIAQNAHEAKIRATIEALARLAGQQIEAWQETLHLFPTPAAVAALTDARLRSTGMGYRAPFVADVARRVVNGRLDPWALPHVPYAEALRRLLEIHGIGDKVADCILLYGCDQRAAFPLDVWVKRIVRENYFPRGRPPTYDRIRSFATSHFGPEAGYAQHFLFHYRRSRGELAAKAE